MPLNIKFQYIDRVEYFLDSSTSQVYSSSNSLAWIWKESKTSISLSHHLGPKDLVNLTFHPSPAQQYATKHLLSSHMKNKLGNSNFKGILPTQISSQNKVLLSLLTLEIKPHFTEFFCLYHPFLELWSSTLFRLYKGFKAISSLACYNKYPHCLLSTCSRPIYLLRPHSLFLYS